MFVPSFPHFGADSFTDQKIWNETNGELLLEYSRVEDVCVCVEVKIPGDEFINHTSLDSSSTSEGDQLMKAGSVKWQL